MKELDIRRAWEGFIEAGTLSNVVRGVVADSWRRSQGHHIPIERSEAPLAPEAELVRCRSEHAMFLEAARPALRQAQLFLGDANSMIILTDASGLILETAGDHRAIDFGQAIHLAEGGRWKEADIGTNAIGTAIAALKPIQIHAVEHFCSDVQRWTCAATPIWHPFDGELIGVVDISGPARTFNPQSLAFAVAVGRQIEGIISQSIKSLHERLLYHFVGKRANWLNDEAIAIDRRGLVVYGPETALRDLERLHGGLIREGKFAALKNVPLTAWPARIGELLPTVSVELVVENNYALGAILVLRKRRHSMGSALTRSRVERSLDFDEILGESVVIRATRERARKMAAVGVPILLEGETGVGKELFARAIHGASTVVEGPFVPVNCGGMPRDLVGSELFGYEKGAFTGARERGHAGKIEAADGGLLCLDEIGEMPLDLQSFLLRILEDGVLYRIGSNEGLPVRFQLISMTNRDLLAEVEAGRFRRDLYYRIAALRISIPPLRERGDDVLLLARHFVHLAALRTNSPVQVIDEAVNDLFRRYSWPGNVRELRNVIENMIVLGNSDRLRLEDVPTEILQQINPPVVSRSLADVPVSLPNLRLSERGAIERALAESAGNLTDAARLLGIARSTLYRKLDEYGIARHVDGDHTA
jgi:sigma-54 dependent transcriptional regulator, acetoin dehydrogenase operon transcriptional activator AcoR